MVQRFLTCRAAQRTVHPPVHLCLEELWQAKMGIPSAWPRPEGGGCSDAHIFHEQMGNSHWLLCEEGITFFFSVRHSHMVHKTSCPFSGMQRDSTLDRLRSHSSER